MLSSRITKISVLLSIYKSPRRVFRLIDIAMLTAVENFQSLNKKLNYYVRSGQLGNPRKGIYTKPDYQPEELACAIYTPSYISLEYVLQKAGIVFQYDSQITSVSYLSREAEVEGRIYRYRKIKENILLNTTGVISQVNQVNIAGAERAFLDLLYLEKDYYFDNLNPLNKETVYALLPIYQSKALTQRVMSLLRTDGHQQT